MLHKITIMSDENGSEEIIVETDVNAAEIRNFLIDFYIKGRFDFYVEKFETTSYRDFESKIMKMVTQ